ncbi:MAG: periplasmic heavy metal sensor [Desulfobacula sp.]|jgi:zinc resistance-associated protein|uniref:Spy/CpxP family protein refolding chaperone n=1 Tax=Desulfobacula sp. TaxID=2593537 RepID=UPI001D663E99|nr:periplasmic heavy metal sensor [Desulfobacula sp.]MBT3485505.1 periplasmic heavy metal sensor [Desulfobacula sp.]MBT3805322.1 periplasmic heavy metal sensor [Desulfobacula sp.]MBT4025674.1 periplasmic heavy metal sensor [Desulfobacula sp.]MBT4197513.1 periplasmic heavy metal sensor [Desulfobacula sp.]
MKKSIIIMGSLLLVALVSGNVFAWGQGGCRGNGQGTGYGNNQDCPRNGGQGAAFNDLTKDQSDELQELRQKFIDETYELRSAKFTKHQEMRMLMETSEPDKAKLDKLSQELSDLQKQVRGKRIDFMLAAKKIAPELGLGKGFGQGRGRGFGHGGGQRGCQGQGQGQGQGNCWNNN